MTDSSAAMQRYLSVSQSAVLHLQPENPDGPRYLTAIRGWVEPEYIVVDPPRIQGRALALREHQSCVLRFVKEGVAVAFDTLIVDWGSQPGLPYLRLLWPKKAQTVQFRRHERVKLTCPCSVVFEDGIESDGELRDISLGGFAAYMPLKVPEGTKLVAQLFLPHGQHIHEVNCVVRRASVEGFGAVLGCEFDGGQDNKLADVATFVSSALALERFSERPSDRVLLLGHDRKWDAAFRDGLSQRGYEVTCAPGLVDAFARLRSHPPRAVVIAADQEQLPAVKIAQIIRVTPGVDQVCLIIAGPLPPADRTAAGDVAHLMEDLGDAREAIAFLEEALQPAV
jgi:c-di-GMP-binding flagellar brake protein YcgR